MNKKIIINNYLKNIFKLVLKKMIIAVSIIPNLKNITNTGSGVCPKLRISASFKYMDIPATIMPAIIEKIPTPPKNNSGLPLLMLLRNLMVTKSKISFTAFMK